MVASSSGVMKFLYNDSPGTKVFSARSSLNLSSLVMREIDSSRFGVFWGSIMLLTGTKKSSILLRFFGAEVIMEH